MTPKENLQLIFESSNRSAPEWIEKGRGLLIAAEIINTELLQISKKYYPTLPDDLQLKFLGLIDALMLLLGFSIENVIKGYIVANKPDYKDISELNSYKYNSAGGHGINVMVSFNIKKVLPREKDLLERLEQTILWAVKYNSPRKFKNDDKKIKSIHPEFREKDFYYCSNLFNKIASLTYQLWDLNERLFYEWRDKYLLKIN